MVEKSRAYIEARTMLDTAKDDKEVFAALLKQGYSQEESHNAINEYHKDEKTRDDDKLIKKIEKRFHKGEDMHVIITSLIAEGHEQFEVEKAVLRANLKD
jgi:hypothetical protein